MYSLNQWSSRCAPVYTSVHEHFFTVHKKICKMKKYFLNNTNFFSIYKAFYNLY